MLALIHAELANLTALTAVATGRSIFTFHSHGKFLLIISGDAGLGQPDAPAWSYAEIYSKLYANFNKLFWTKWSEKFHVICES